MAQPPGGRSPFSSPSVGAPRTTQPPNPAFAPFGLVDSIRRAPRRGDTVIVGQQAYREVDNGRANVLIPVDDPLRAAQREAIVRALFMAGHTFGTMGYGVAATAGAPQRTRDAALLAGGLVDDVATGRASRSGPVRRTRLSPHGQVAPPSLERDRIRLGELNANQQATRVTATLTKDLLGTGSEASRRIWPPGFLGGREPYFSRGQGPYLDARGHLLGNQLGGRGDDARNLVTLTQGPSNSPQMRSFEHAVARRLRAGEAIEYSAVPMYRQGALPPSAILVTATGSRARPVARLIHNPAAYR